jgi:hypothetical protein
MILNITWNGMSADTDVAMDYGVIDRDVKRIAVELVRSGGVPGLHVANLPGDAFEHFVVDRFDTPEGGRRLFLRPKVPFGARGGCA